MGSSDGGKITASSHSNRVHSGNWDGKKAKALHLFCRLYTSFNPKAQVAPTPPYFSAPAKCKYESGASKQRCIYEPTPSRQSFCFTYEFTGTMHYSVSVISTGVSSVVQTGKLVSYNSFWWPKSFDWERIDLASLVAVLR